MESVTGKSPISAALAGNWTRRDSYGLALGAVAVAAIVAIDFGVADTALIGVLVAPPFFTALLARTSVTVVVGLLALSAAAVSGEWNMNFGTTAYWIRLGVIAGATALAALSAWNRRHLRLQSDRLRILDDVGAIADGSRPLAETLRRVTELVVPQVADLCMVDVIHGGRATRAAVRVAPHPRRGEIEDRIASRAPELPRWLLTEERAWRHIPRWRPRLPEEELHRMARSPEDLDFLLSLAPQSLIVVPIASRERNLGALTLISAWSGRRYSGDDVHFAQILASRIGLALDNAGLFSDLESIERRMDNVMSLLEEAVVIHSRDGDLIYANPAAARTMGFETPEELISAPATEITRRLALRDEAGHPLDAKALTGNPEISRTRARTAVVRATDLRTGLEHWYRTRARAVPGPDDEPLYSVTAIEDVTDVKRAEFSQSLLARAGELLGRSSEHRRTLEQAAKLVVPEFADWCELQLKRADGPAETVAAGERQSIAEAVREVARAVGAGAEDRRLMAGADEGSAIAVPMSAGGDVIGALALANGPESRTFDAEDLKLAVELGRRAGIAIEQARIAEARARVAETLQRELLPPDLPRTPGWEVATMYRPAGEVNDVGGDFYEAFTIGEGWALVLGDVSGHGASAASITALARHTMRTATTLSGDPAVGLSTLDNRLRERGAVALCSVAVALLPQSAGEECEVQIWLAGHPPPFLLRDGVATEIGVPGPLVGIGEGDKWTTATVSMRTGDQLVIYTDGVTEARGEEGERFGAERLRDRLAACGEPRVTVGEVEAALARFERGEPKDDAALVAVRRLAAAPDEPRGTLDAALAG